VGGHLHHTAGVAGGADAAARAGQGHEPLGGARGTADAGEAVGEDAAAEVRAEVVLDLPWDAVASGVGPCGLGEEGLEVVLDERVEGCGGGVAAAVDGGEAVLRGGAAECGKGPRGAAQPVRVGAGVGMPTTVGHQAGRRNGGAGQRRG
jgi:hypothetical protein